MSTQAMSSIPQRQRRANLRLAIILASVAAALAAGFVAKVILMGR